jgi:hypothetical protein
MKVNGRVVVEFADGTKRTLPDELYEQYNLRIQSIWKKLPGQIGIKSALQINEKQLKEVNHSYKHISKPVVIEEPQNVSRAYYFTAR